MASINDIIKNGLIAIIKFYRFAISCLLGHCCRFEPSCSTYAMDAIKIHGCFKGCFLSVRRVLCCHPWHPGGLDPVPNAKVENMSKSEQSKNDYSINNRS